MPACQGGPGVAHITCQRRDGQAGRCYAGGSKRTMRQETPHRTKHLETVMKKIDNTPTKKLSINKQTLRQLGSNDLADVAGGIVPTRDTPCTAPTTIICK